MYFIDPTRVINKANPYLRQKYKFQKISTNHISAFWVLKLDPQVLESPNLIDQASSSTQMALRAWVETKLIPRHWCHRALELPLSSIRVSKFDLSKTFFKHSNIPQFFSIIWYFALQPSSLFLGSSNLLTICYVGNRFLNLSNGI